MRPLDLVLDFGHHHYCDLGSLPLEEMEAIQCVCECHNAISEGYAGLPPSVFEKEPSIGFLWQLFERCTEHVHGGLVAIATSCAASSEVLARVILEATTTIRYILLDRNPRLAAYLQRYCTQSDRQTAQWMKAAENLPGSLSAIHIEAGQYRKQALFHLKNFANSIIAELVPSGTVPAWPSNAAALFEALGGEMTYRTFYARLCAETHLDAEETLRYIIGKIAAEELVEKMAVETVMYSRFCLFEAVRSYAATGKEYAQTFQLDTAIETCRKAEALLQNHVFNLSQHIGAFKDR